MVGPTSKVSEEDLDQFVKSFELVKKVPAVASSAGDGSPEPSIAAEPASPASGGPTVATAEDSPPAARTAAGRLRRSECGGSGRLSTDADGSTGSGRGCCHGK